MPQQTLTEKVGYYMELDVFYHQHDSYNIQIGGLFFESVRTYADKVLNGCSFLHKM